MRGPGDDAAVDRVAQVHVAVHRAQRLEVAQGGEADHQVFLRVGERSQRAVLIGVAQDLVIEIGSIAEDVSVGVDQPGKDGSVSQINHFSVCGHLHLLRRADFNNAIPFDQDHLIGGELLSSVKQAAGTDRNPVIRRRGRLSESECADQ